MINYAYLLTHLESKMNEQPLTSLQRSNLMNEAKALLLSDIQVGDQLEGIILTENKGKLMLQLKAGMSLWTEIKGNVELNKMMTFTVQEKGEQGLVLQPYYNEQSSKTSLVQKTMDSFGLPQNDEMKEIISDFLKMQLPLTKESLLKGYELYKAYALPSKVIANFMDHKEGLSPQKAQVLTEFKTQGMETVFKQVGEILPHLEKINDLVEIFNVLKANIPHSKIECILKEIESSLEQPAVSSSEDSKLRSDSGKEKEVSEIILKNQKFPMTELNGIKEIIKKAIEVLYKKETFVTLEKMKQGELESTKPFETQETLSKLIKTLSKAELSPQDQEVIHHVKENLSVLKQANIEGQYYIFPMVSEDSSMQGEVYFFKPKKGNSKQKEHLYVVLALDFPAIRHLEVHIQKEEKDLYLTLKVEKEEIRDTMMEHMLYLNQIVENLGFNLRNVVWGILNEDKFFETLNNKTVQEEWQHMDFKV